MNRLDFYNAVSAHDDLDWLGVHEPTSEVRVRCVSRGVMWALPVAAVDEHDWETLEKCLLCLRETRIMSQMTRIVGYWSRVDNWNRSKIAELRDRQKGDYAVPGG